MSTMTVASLLKPNLIELLDFRTFVFRDDKKLNTMRLKVK